MNKGASTDTKKHFEVINFIVNVLEKIYQENVLDVSSPLSKFYKDTDRL